MRNSFYRQPHNSHRVGSENLVSDPLNHPQIHIFLSSHQYHLAG